MKKVIMAILLLSTISLVACGTNNESSDKDVNQQNEQDSTNMGVDDILSFSASSEKEKDTVRFELTLRNETEKDVKVTFSSSQKYEIIVSKDDTIVYQYSKDKMFTQATTEEIIKSNEQLVLEEEWQYDHSLASGEYDVEIQLLVTEVNEEKVDAKKFSTTGSLQIESEEATDTSNQEEEIPEDMIKNVEVTGDNGAYMIRGEVHGAIGTLFYEVEDGHQYLIDATEVPIEANNKWTEFDMEVSISEDKLPTNGALILFLYNEDRSVQLPIQLELFQ